MALRDYPKDQRPIVIAGLLDLMRHEPVTMEAAAFHLFRATDPYSVTKAETILDELWDVELCYNGGKFRDYKYFITDEGRDYLNGKINPRTRGGNL